MWATILLLVAGTTCVVYQSLGSPTTIRNGIVTTTARAIKPRSSEAEENGALAGAIIGSIVGAIIIAVGIFFLIRRNRRRKKDSDHASHLFDIDEEAPQPTPFIPTGHEDHANYHGAAAFMSKSSGEGSQLDTTVSPRMTTVSQSAGGASASLPTSNAVGVPTPPISDNMRTTSQAKAQLATAEAIRTAATHSANIAAAPNVPAQDHVSTSRPTHAEDAEDASMLPPLYNPRWAEQQRARGEGSGSGSSKMGL